MIRGATNGTAVVVVDVAGRPRTTGSYTTDGQTWDFTQGNTGRVVDVERYPHLIFIVVRPDAPNPVDATFRFMPRYLARSQSRPRQAGD